VRRFLSRIAQIYRGLPERARRVVNLTGYAVLGLVVFVIALYYSFPWRKATDKIEAALSQATGMDVSIGDVHPTVWPGVTLTDVVLTSRPVPTPMQPNPKPASLVIDSITVHPGLLAALSGKTDVSFAASLGGGTLSGSEVASKDGSQLDLTIDGVGLDKVPGLQDLDGVPMTGPISGHVTLNVPPAGIQTASGEIDLTCNQCTIGDGVHSVRMPDYSGGQSAGGFTLPRIHLGQLQAQMPIKQGLATFQTFHAQSQDGDLYMEGSLALAQPFSDSRLQIYIRFLLDPALVAREERLQFLMGSGIQMGKRPDGYYGEKLFGTLKVLRMMPSKDDFLAPLSPTTPLPPPPPPPVVQQLPAAPTKTAAPFQPAPVPAVPPAPLPVPQRPPSNVLQLAPPSGAARQDDLDH
jgi:type II secretion system protein N